MKTRKEMMTLPWGLPEVFQWENYTKAWEKADFQILMKNSICIPGKCEMRSRMDPILEGCLSRCTAGISYE